MRTAVPSEDRTIQPLQAYFESLEQILERLMPNFEVDDTGDCEAQYDVIMSNLISRCVIPARATHVIISLTDSGALSFRYIPDEEIYKSEVEHE